MFGRGRSYRHLLGVPLSVIAAVIVALWPVDRVVAGSLGEVELYTSSI